MFIILPLKRTYKTYLNFCNAWTYMLTTPNGNMNSYHWDSSMYPSHFFDCNFRKAGRSIDFPCENVRANIHRKNYSSFIHSECLHSMHSLYLFHFHHKGISQIIIRFWRHRCYYSNWIRHYRWYLELRRETLSY